MIKRVLSTIIMLLVAVFLFVASPKAMESYECLVQHYPDEFVEVELYEDPSDFNLEPNVFDKGKAIYERRYVYANKIYQTEIAQDEFDEKFYVCKYKPFKAYSESDLEEQSEDLIFSFILKILGVILVLVAMCRVMIGIIKKARSNAVH